jgi:hypothetical protein
MIFGLLVAFDATTDLGMLLGFGKDETVFFAKKLLTGS